MNRVSYTTTMSAANAACDAILSLRSRRADGAVAAGMAERSLAGAPRAAPTRSARVHRVSGACSFTSRRMSTRRADRRRHEGLAFCHVMPGAVIGERVQPRAERRRHERHADRDNCKIQNNVSIYEGVELEDDVFCGPSMVFTNVINPRSARVAQERVPAHAGAARRVDRRQRDDRVRRDARRVRVRRRGRGRSRRTCYAYALMAGVPARRIGWMCQCGERLSTAVGRCAACGTTCERSATASRRNRAGDAGSTVGAGQDNAEHGDEDLITDRFASRWSAAAASARTTSTPSRKVDGPVAAAVCDIDAERAHAKPARSRACRAYSTLDEMLRRRRRVRRRRDLHAVRAARGAGRGRRARAGKHVVTEKPMAISLAQADDLVQRLRRRPACSCSSSSRTDSIRRFSCSSGRSTRAIRPHLHGERHGALAASAGVLRRGAVARHVGVRRRRDHEPGVALRRSDPVARRARWRA